MQVKNIFNNDNNNGNLKEKKKIINILIVRTKINRKELLLGIRHTDLH